MPIPEGNIKREKIEALDFVRALCAIGIILFHISCYTSAEAKKVLYTYANGDFGQIIVGVFLLISGGVLYHNYSNIPSLSVFYYKRWKSIFPMFYITWLHFYVQGVLEHGELFWKGKKVLLLSLLGMDGYFYYRVDNYYSVGEWFLGAIVFLYLLYPIYTFLVNKIRWKILFIMIPLWIWQINSDFFVISDSRNIIYCSLLFVIGMLLFRYGLYRHILLRIASLIISAIILFVPIPGPDACKSLLLIVSIFVVLFSIGELVMKVGIVGKCFAFLGGLSFPMFLVQNKIGGRVVSLFAPSSTTAVWKAIVLSVVLCVIYAWCIKSIGNSILRTRWYLKIESFFIKKET